jgi:hypothetical protein
MKADFNSRAQPNAYIPLELRPQGQSDLLMVAITWEALISFGDIGSWPLWTLWGQRTAISEWAGILGLAVTISVAWGVRRFRRQIQGIQRIPDIKDGLQKLASQLVKVLGDFPDSERQVNVCLSQILANLKILSDTSTTPDIKRTARQIVKKIGNIDRSSIFIKDKKAKDEKAWEIYAHVNGLLEKLRHLEAEQKKGLVQ